LTGAQGFVVTAMPQSATLSLGAGFTGNAAGTLATNGAADALTIELAGSVATSAAAGASASLLGATETVTVNVSANSSIRTAAAELFGSAGVAAAHNLTGSGNLNIHASAANFGTMVLNGSGIGYTGSLTVSPSTDAAMDFSAALTTVTGIDTIDLRNIATYASAITLDSANGTQVPNISYAPVAAGIIGAMTVAKEGSGLSDAVKISLGSLATAITSVIATSVETVTVARSGAASVTLGAVTLTDGVGTQKIVVTSAGAVVANTFTADSIDFSGVAGAVTNLTLANTAGATFSGGPGATTVTGSAQADVINTGIGADNILGGGGADVINGGAGADRITSGVDATDLLTGGSGVDTFVYTGGVASLFVNSLAAAATVDTITDFVAGTDKIALVNAGTAVTSIVLTPSTVATAANIGAVLTGIGNSTPLTTGGAQSVGLVTVSAGAAAGVYLHLNDGVNAAAAIDSLIHLVGVTGTVTTADFLFA
jgi:hypothetical protein